MSGLRIRSEVPDDKLVSLMQEGDERAYTEFVRRWQPLLTDTARRLGFSVDDADDLVADVLVEVAAAFGAGREAPRTMGSYLVTALRNRARNHWRNEERRRAREAKVPESGEVEEPAVPPVDAEAPRTAPPLLRLAQALTRGLTREERLLLVWAGHRVPHRTIAEWLGSNPGAVSKRIERLRARLQQAAEEHLKDVVEQAVTALADGTVPRTSAIAGEVVLVSKLATAQTSDTVSGTDRPALVEPWLLPEPLLPVALHARATKDEDKLTHALQRLIAEDLTLRLERNAETHQLVLWTLGPAHVEDVLDRLRERHHVEVSTEPVRTSLRETFVRPVQTQGRLVKQSGGHGQYAVVQLHVEPLPRGAGVEFVDKVVGGAVPRAYIPSVEKGARAQLQEGVLAGYPCVDVRVTLLDGKAHSVDSSDMAFQTAAALALREAANESTVSLLEPVDTIEVSVADDHLGAVLADLRGRRAQVQATLAGELPGHTVVVADVPQHELSRYPIDLRSVAHGSGSFTRAFARYDYLPAALAREVTG